MICFVSEKNVTFNHLTRKLSKDPGFTPSFTKRNGIIE